jgi:hypothetical protein
MNAEVSHLPQVIQPSAPMQMLREAITQNVDTERLKALMELQREWQADEARRQFNIALAAFKKDPPVVVKDLLNKQYGSWYTSLGNLVNTVNAALGQHGLNASWDIEQGEGSIAVICILEHEAGHSRRVRLEGPPDTSGTKNSLQSIRSTLTYLRGATFEAVTGIASRIVNQDDDGNDAGKRPAQAKAPEGYENWKADMRAVADEGSEKLQATWAASSPEFRRHVIKTDEAWWNETKRKASKVKPAEAAQ